MSIEREDVLPLLLAAVPTFAPTEDREEFVGDLALYDDAVVLCETAVDDPSILGPWLAVVERMLVEGDDAVRNAAVTGHLEKLCRRVRDAEVPRRAVLDALGPESAEIWPSVERFVGPPLTGPAHAEGGGGFPR